jgi:hypothetical protein
MIDGVAAQTSRYQAVAISNGVPILSKAAAGMPIWQNNLATLRLCLMNLDEVLKQIQEQVESLDFQMPDMTPLGLDLLGLPEII